MSTTYTDTPCTCLLADLHDRTCLFLLTHAPYGRCSRCRCALTLPPIWPQMIGPSYCGKCSAPSPSNGDSK